MGRRIVEVRVVISFKNQKGMRPFSDEIIENEFRGGTRRRFGSGCVRPLPYTVRINVTVSFYRYEATG